MILHAPLTKKHWKNIPVLILGLGQYPSGSGVSAALMFAKLGANVTVTDQKSAKELSKNVSRLKKYKNVRFVMGRHDLADIDRAKLIVANPRVRPSSEEMKRARKKGIPVVSDISLFLDNCPATVIGVTGTRGKSTTSTLIAAMLKASKKRVWLGGNILVSPLTFVSRVKKNDIVVLELSSWQCESLPMTSRPPHISVVTNMMRDHLNTYQGMDDYAEAKAQIFRHQKPNDMVIFNADDAYGKRWIQEASGTVLSFGKKGMDAKILNGALCFGSSKVIDLYDMKLIGEHNAMNALAAMLAAGAAGATSSGITHVLKTFSGLENRLQTISKRKGITWINDTTATTPDGAIAAFKALHDRHCILWFIMGGSDKKLDYAELGKVFASSKRVGIFLLPGDASKKMIKVFKRHSIAYEEVSSMKMAVQRAREVASSGDAVILSPAAASFGLFKNEFDRGEQFVTMIRRIK
ncbi:MAG: UDP-N-acetylmuramoyl-L-alanine--D-glutamate ligase [Patescibacteria group bacterium]